MDVDAKCPQVGYCQGSAFIVGLLLMQVLPPPPSPPPPPPPSPASPTPPTPPPPPHATPLFTNIFASQMPEEESFAVLVKIMEDYRSAVSPPPLSPLLSPSPLLLPPIFSSSPLLLLLILSCSWHEKSASRDGL